MSLLPIFIIVVTATVALAVVGTLRKNGNSTQRQPNQNVDPATAPPAGSANTGTTQVTTVVKSKWFIMITILVVLLLLSIPTSVWGQIFSDGAVAKTIAIVIIALIAAGFRNAWTEDRGKKLVGRLTFFIVIIAVGALLYQKADGKINIDDVKACLPSLPTAGATPATSPAPATTAPKATVNKGKGTIIKVPGKVPGDNAWKHAYIFQLKSGYLRFQWDIEGPMGWEVRDEKTGKVYSDADVKDPNKKVPIPQNGWIRIRAKGSTPLQVTVYTYW